MAKIPAGQIHLKLEDLAEKIAAGLTDKEIMQDLQIKRRTFYNYKAKVSRTFGNVTEKKMEEKLEFETEMLKERYLRLFRNLEERITKADDSPKSHGLQEIANASEVAAFIATNILRLEFEGFMARKTRRELEQGKQKALKYLESRSEY